MNNFVVIDNKTNFAKISKLKDTNNKFWFWDYNKKAGFEYLKHNKDFGKRVL